MAAGAVAYARCCVTADGDGDGYDEDDDECPAASHTNGQLPIPAFGYKHANGPRLVYGYARRLTVCAEKTQLRDGGLLLNARVCRQNTHKPIMFVRE